MIRHLPLKTTVLQILKEAILINKEAEEQSAVVDEIIVTGVRSTSVGQHIVNGSVALTTALGENPALQRGIEIAAAIVGGPIKYGIERAGSAAIVAVLPDDVVDRIGEVGAEVATDIGQVGVGFLTGETKETLEGHSDDGGETGERVDLETRSLLTTAGVLTSTH